MVIKFDEIEPGIMLQHRDRVYEVANCWLLDQSILVEPQIFNEEEIDEWLNFSPRPKAIFLTHWHGDHSAYSRLLSILLKIPAYGLRGDVIPEEVLGWKVIHTPGHAKEHICFYRGDVIVAGDMLYENGEPAFIPNQGGDRDTYVESCARLATMDFRLALLGHGPALYSPSSYFVRAK